GLHNLATLVITSCPSRVYRLVMTHNWAVGTHITAPRPTREMAVSVRARLGYCEAKT
ncbi:hypothetical protein J6590_004940, partial [Homalodisca vitripennis]